MAETVRTVNRFDLLDNDTPRKPKHKPTSLAPTRRNDNRDRKPNHTTNDGNNNGNNRRGGRGRGRGRNGGRGGGHSGNGNGNGQRRGREFDRRSGTGRGRDTSNKNSQFGWGGDGTDEHAKNVETPTEEPALAPAAEATEGDDKKAETTAAPAEPEEPPTKTYEEAMAEKKMVQTDQAIRQATNADFNGKAGRKLTRKVVEEKTFTRRTKKNTRNTVNLEQFSGVFSGNNNRGREGRDGRGRGRGRDGRGRGRGRGRGGHGRGRDSGRNQNQDQQQRRGGNRTVNISDDSSFPSLGGN